MLQDSFYTPKVLADKLVNFIKKNNYQTVADFCVGDGELLRAAIERWPEIKCYGSDISEDAIKSTKAQHKNWKLCLMDFLNEESRRRSSILKKHTRYDLILSNPPFSCIGGTVNEIEFDNEIFQVSTAMKFLVLSLKFLKPAGVLYAILPTSVAYSQRDKLLWNALEKKHNLAILDEPKIQYFKGCTPNVILVSVNDFSQVSKHKSIPRIALDFDDMDVFRGKLSMNLVRHNSAGDFLVHSTHLKNNSINGLKTKVIKDLSIVTGPAVLIPRVGKPLSSKLCIIKETETYVLSDCVFAIKTANLQDSFRLFTYMLDNWDAIAEMYTGTGARYITTDKLRQFLNLDHPELQNRKAI